MATHDWTPPTHAERLLADATGAVRVSETQWSDGHCPNPNHDDATPSFGFTRGTKRPIVVNCFGCDDWEGLTEGLRGIGLNPRQVSRRRSGPSARIVKRVRGPEAVVQGLADQAKPQRWHKALLAGQFPDELVYLQEHRGLSLDTIERFTIGHDGTRITIPVRIDGTIVNIRRYDASASKNKMLNEIGHGTNTLAFTEVLSGNDLPVIVAEGEWDALLVNQMGIGGFVAVTGTAGAKSVPKDLSALAGREVFIGFDTDDSGVEGAQKWVEQLRQSASAVRIFDLTELGMPFGDKSMKDWTDYFQLGGGTAQRVVVEMDRLRRGDGKRERFQVVSAAELAEPVAPMDWLVKGVWALDSFGTLAGEKKTLKTYTLLALALAVASGEPFLGQFEVPKARPVLMYLGEGGQAPTIRRLQRMASAMDVSLARLPLRMVFDSGDLTGDDFLESLTAAVRVEKPGLIVIDPLYAFHPPGIEAQNMYDRGAMLAEVHASMPPGVAFILADHFRKTGGKDLDLDSIAQSGMGVWADSWILQNHASPPRVDEGEFSIGIQFGSRQWGGQQYVVDWSVGRFDPDTGEHLGDISVAVRSVGWGEKAQSSARTDAIGAHILTLLEQEPLEHTQTGAREVVKKLAKVGEAHFKAVWDELVEDGRIVSERALGSDGRTRLRWRVSTDPRPKLSVSGGDAR
ncbi:AAA family ATPase [Leifsonia sp. NPDC102414]|uniref:AAA family ATPase n=1 Tax=Leifsonia sp. NPDC102414 TaxID=3364124 RepID=UPI0037F4DAA1